MALFYMQSYGYEVLFFHLTCKEESFNFYESL